MLQNRRFEQNILTLKNQINCAKGMYLTAFEFSYVLYNSCNLQESLKLQYQMLAIESELQGDPNRNFFFFVPFFMSFFCPQE